MSGINFRWEWIKKENFFFASLKKIPSHFFIKGDAVMGWQDILKVDDQARFKNTVLEAMKETNWEIEDSYENFWYFTNLTFYHSLSKVKITGYIRDIHSLSNENPWDFSDNRGFKSMPSVENVKEVLAPTLRSLDWMLELIEQMGNKVEVETAGRIIVTGTGSTYIIRSTQLNDGCYVVQTEEGYDICIVDRSEKPMGDIMVSLILTLANDEQASSEIEGIEEYLYGGIDVDCQTCDNSMYVSWGDEEVQCEECGLTYTVADVYFRPNADIELEQNTIVSPKGNRYDRYDIEYMHDGWWRTEDYLFNAINHDTVFVDSTGEEIVEHHSGVWFGQGDSLLYNSDGDEMPLDEVWNIINNEGNFLDLVYKESNVEPDESEVAELLGYEATTDANYTKDGKYFTFDESDYFQEVEKPEDILGR